MKTRISMERCGLQNDPHENNKSVPKKPNKEPTSDSDNQLMPAEESKQSKKFPVVGVGASAGGLDAFKRLFGNLPSDTGMAFVLVQHLAPSHTSILSELLAKVTSMPVAEITDGMVVEPDHVYVIPPSAELAIYHGVLRLTVRKETRGQYLPINYFFNTLAEDQDGVAIGVVLSGTGKDGTEGLKAIKAEGGIVFVQDPDSAEQTGMPQSAIAANVADFILTPENIAVELMRIARHPYLAQPKAIEIEETTEEQAANLFDKIFIILRRAVGVDFSNYKQATIKRRVARRMALLKIEKLEDYVDFLRENPAEAQVLYQDILIMVTEFFRDPEAFDILKREVFPVIVKDKSQENPVRIWVPGCSTGQEAYSIAMALLEFIESTSQRPAIQIFATDINERDIEVARLGVYPETIDKEVSPERLRRFFSKIDVGYQVSKSIREICVFAKHDVTRDPPFSKQDLISFRNVLIYLNPILQKRVIPLFHYALNPSGFLMLGSSESIGEFTNLFKTIDKKYRIYSKKPAATKLLTAFASPVFPTGVTPVKADTAVAKKPELPLFDVLREGNQIILENYAPAGFIVDDAMNILQFHGHTSPYLEPATGEAALNLKKMLRKELVYTLQAAIQEAKSAKVTVSKKGLSIEDNGFQREFDVDVVPIISPAGEFYFIVLFKDVEQVLPHEAKEAVNKTVSAAEEDTEKDREIEQMKRMLAEAEKRLQITTEEKDTTNEELRAANEEIQSSNEELQSINEELETAKEELQSTNEELLTVNNELQSRNSELGQLNDDLNNLIKSTDIPILILGSDLHIRKFTPTAEKILNVIPSDIGRPVGDIKRKIDVPDLEEMVSDVITNLGVRTEDVQDLDGHWYTMQIRPYKTADNRIEGAVLAFLDIDMVKRSLEQAESARDYAENIVETLWEPLLILSEDFKVVGANKSFYRAFATSRENTIGELVYNLGNKQWDIPQLRTLLEDVIPKKKSFEGFEVDHVFEQIGYKVMLLNARMIEREGEKNLILLAIEDITDRKQYETLSQAINKIDAIINSTLEYNEIMQKVVNESAKVVGCDSVAVYQLINDSWKITNVYGLPDELIDADLTHKETDIANLTIEAKKAVAINDAFKDFRLDRKWLEEYNIRAILAVPLMARGISFGVLAFNFNSGPVRFSSHQLDFANKLATSVSIALENARLYEAERNIADILQESLLIMPDHVDGIEFGHLYHSATEAAKVGGDFYDIFEIDSERIGIILGDVSGKGIEAATLTSIVKNTIKAHAFENNDPGSIMSKTNEMVLRSSPSSIFVTVIYAVLNIATGEIVYCDAGHPPAIIRKSLSDIEMLAEYSPIIGAFENVRYENGRATLKDGDVLILYTDGVIEARRGHEFFGEERLVSFVKNTVSTETKSIPGAIFNQVQKFTNHKLSDDVAILTVSYVKK
jgi:two-component system CheB/CheR fusion protein